MLGTTLVWLYCVVWAGHDPYVVPDPSQPVDSVFCRRCLSKQGEKGWYNIGALHPRRWLAPLTHVRR